MQLSEVLHHQYLWPFLTSILLVLAIRWLVRFVWEVKHLPPGPWGLPIVGYLPWVDPKAYLTFQQLKQRYGSIFRVKLGPQTVVILADWTAVKATLVDQSQLFGGRPSHHTFETATRRCSVSFNDGKVWTDQRRLMMKCLRKVGVGRKRMEDMVMRSVESIMDCLTANDNKVISLETVFFKNIMSVIWQMVASRNIAAGDKDGAEFEKLVCKTMNNIRANNPINFMPWLRFAPPNGFGYWEFMRTTSKVMKYLEEEIESHWANWKEGQEEDVIDIYISAIKENQKNPSNKPLPHLTIRNLTSTLWDLFIAGTDTTSTTTMWGMLYICKWPEVQKKAQHEMDTVIGRERLPCLDDFQSGKLPYVDAMIMEMHRYASIVPLSLAHCPLETTTVLGYTIPKRIPCFQSIYGIHHDPELWLEPDKFNPERFLNANNEAKWPPYLMPFSIGPRICPGEGLSSQELRLIFGCLLHRYNFSIPPGHDPTLQPIIALVTRPQPYELLIQARKD